VFHSSKNSKECVKDWDQLNLVMVVCFYAFMPFFATAPANSKMMLALKMVKIDSEMLILLR